MTALDGVPIAYTCPEPVPASVEDTVVLKNSPSPYAAPLDKELGPKLLPFADQILGRETSYRNKRVAKDLEPKLYGFWNGLWLKTGGK